MSESHTEAPVVHVEPHGMLANRMIQYMVAMTLARQVPGCVIANVDLPEWNIHHPPIESRGPVATTGTQHRIDIAGLAARLRAGDIRRVVLDAYGQRLENFLDRETYRATFRPASAEPVGFDERHLVCHVRAGEVLSGLYPEYPLTPVEFYAEIIAETGLQPVFLGQTEPNVYTDRLRERFPAALFLPPRDVVLDFETIRQSRNIALGVSTFAWLAAWLSDADHIFMAVSGLFNPMQYAEVFLLPLDDPRYRFTLFPVNFGIHPMLHAEHHRRLSPFWRRIPPPLLARQLMEAPRFPRTAEMLLAAFDAAFYLGEYRDVADVVGADNLAGAQAHFEQFGLQEMRLPFRLDQHWYAQQYPMAAFEVAQGDYLDFVHHYLAIGRARGYRPHS